MRQLYIVEDNEADLVLIMEILKELDENIKVHFSKDGAEAIDFLIKVNRNQVEFKPDLILLDINIPKIDGFEVLNFIKSSEALKKIPVIILSTSSAEKDKKFAYVLKSDGFLTKSPDLNEFIGTLESIKAKWLS
jgi:chemotaxis family two-component system response regulator Rcp1